MVGGDAALAGIEPLAPGQPPCRGGDVGVGQHDRRVFAPQLQGDRREVAGCCGQHQPPHPAPAGEEDVVEPFFKQLGGHGPITADHLHHLGGEGLWDGAGQQLGGAWRVFGRLEHGGVARGQGAHQRLQAELEGVVPGPDDQHAAQGFGLYPGLAGPQNQIEADRPWPHPALQLPAGVGQFFAHPHQFEVGLQGRFAQVGGQGLEHLPLVVAQQPL